MLQHVLSLQVDVLSCLVLVVRLPVEAYHVNCCCKHTRRPGETQCCVVADSGVLVTSLADCFSKVLARLCKLAVELFD